jgi:hypothetical protein
MENEQIGKPRVFLVFSAILGGIQVLLMAAVVYLLAIPMSSLVVLAVPILSIGILMMNIEAYKRDKSEDTGRFRKLAITGILCSGFNTLALILYLVVVILMLE